MSEDKRFCEIINDKEWIDYKFEYENNQRVMKDLYKQLDLYKSVIEEVREALSHIDDDIMATCKNYDVNGIELKKILDKGVKDE